MTSDPLINLLNQCIVRISLPEEETWSGTGFFVTPDLVLTCAHVLSSRAKQGEIAIICREGCNYRATVTRILPQSYPDLALLCLKEPPLDQPCVQFATEARINDWLYTFGYPKFHPNGRSTTFILEGRGGGNQQPMLNFKLGNVERGLSGAPLLNLRTGKVCGIVVETEKPGSVVGGNGIPTETILNEFPELLQPQQAFHEHDHRWQQAWAEQQAPDRTHPVPPKGRLNGGRKRKLSLPGKTRFFITAGLLALFLFSLVMFVARVVPSPLSVQPTRQTSSQNIGELHDQNLAARLIGTQQNTFALPGDPLKLSPKQFSKQGAPALCIDQPGQQVPTVFQIAIRISNLRQDQYQLLIEQVQIVVERIASIPHPLYALVQNPPVLSNYNLYRGTYTSQDTHVSIPTSYDYPPYNYVYLSLHETDKINVQVTSLVEIAITYRVANEGQTHTLQLPNMFQVDFSDKSNLHLYQQLRDGHFTQLDTP